MSLADALRVRLPPGLALASENPRAPPAGLWPAEAQATTRMTPARLREFAAGRRAAALAMSALGLPDAPVPMGADRAPVWPDGVTGSITHDATVCLALVGLLDGWAGLGLDLETDTPLPADIADTVCLPGEAEDARAARDVFCVKEAAYKAFFPTIATVLEFRDIAVTRGPGDRFRAELTRDAGPLGTGTQISGHILRVSGKVAALALWPRETRA